MSAITIQENSMAKLVELTIEEISALESNGVHYPYRKGRVRPSQAAPVQRVDRDDTIEALEYKLAAALGVRRDNHVVYGVVDKDGRELFIGCNDFHAYIGTAVDTRFA